MKKYLPKLLTVILLMTAGLMGCNKSDTVTVIPELTTTDVVIDGATKNVWTGGFLTANTEYGISAYGVCYSTSNQAPTIADSKTSETVSLMNFSSTLSGLTMGTTYYLRAYATNSAGTGYGAVISFSVSNDAATVSSTVTTLAGNGTAGFINGQGSAAYFNYPMGVSTDAAGNVYVADSYNSAIRKVTPAGDVTTLAGTGTLGFVNGDAASAQFYAASASVADAAGNIYVADRGNNLIRKIATDGTVSTFAGYGIAGYGDGTGVNAYFNTPSGIAIDAAGNLYVADTGNNLIRKITPEGVVTTLAGIRTAGYVNATGTAAYFNKPTGIAVDNKGNIFVAEALNNVIRKIDVNLLVSTYAGGQSATGLVGSPVALSIDGTGNLYIADSGGRILRIGTDKVLSVVAGTAGVAGFADGDGSTAAFNSPQGIATDAAGNIYVADYANQRIRKIRVD
ncbi:NHL repeat-containing protein [Mucilaginibacter gynuensis]